MYTYTVLTCCRTVRCAVCGVCGVWCAVCSVRVFGRVSGCWREALSVQHGVLALLSAPVTGSRPLYLSIAMMRMTHTTLARACTMTACARVRLRGHAICIFITGRTLFIILAKAGTGKTWLTRQAMRQLSAAPGNVTPCYESHWPV